NIQNASIIYNQTEVNPTLIQCQGNVTLTSYRVGNTKNTGLCAQVEPDAHAIRIVPAHRIGRMMDKTKITENIGIAFCAKQKPVFRSPYGVAISKKRILGETPYILKTTQSSVFILKQIGGCPGQAGHRTQT